MTETPSTPPAYQAAQPLSSSDERLWASLAHFGNILGFLPSLLIFLIMGPRSAHVKTEAKEALNFVITAVAAWIVLAIVGFVFLLLYAATPSGIDTVFSLLQGLVTLLQWAVWIAVIVFSIIAGVRVNQGGSYRYPVAIRLIK